MAVAVPYESLKRWTNDEIRQMIESGGFQHPERFELVDGLILEKMGQNEPHIIGVVMATRALRIAFQSEADVVAGVPLHLASHSSPEPDVLVTSSGLRHAPTADVVRLVVEVSDTSLRTDQTVKAALYARHSIPQYLLINLVDRTVEIRRFPDPQSETWRETLILREDASFLLNDASIKVSDLLPDPEESA